MCYHSRLRLLDSLSCRAAKVLPHGKPKKIFPRTFFKSTVSGKILGRDDIGFKSIVAGVRLIDLSLQSADNIFCVSFFLIFICKVTAHSEARGHNSLPFLLQTEHGNLS